MAHPLVELLFAPHEWEGGDRSRARGTEVSDAASTISGADARLAQQIRDGEIDAFETLFRTYYHGVTTYLAHMVGSVWDAEELAQKVFVTLWERRTEFVPRTGMRTYLYGAARHAGLNHFRELRRPLPPADSVISEMPMGADAELEQGELERAVRAAIEALPARAREMWTLHREHGLTVAEVAALLGVSSNTVKTQLARSLATLRRVATPFLLALIAIRL